MIDALRSYAALAGGLTEATASKARDLAGTIIDQALALTGRAGELSGVDAKAAVDDLAADIVASAQESREALTQLVRAEVDRAVARLGFVREDELAALRRHVERLESQVSGLATAPAGRVEQALEVEPTREVEPIVPADAVPLSEDEPRTEEPRAPLTPSPTEQPRPVKTKTRIAD